jgi:hypothetical protein
VGNVIGIGIDETHATEDESVASEGMDGDPGTPRSLYVVTAMKTADFFEEYWGTQEHVDEHPFKDYDEWFYGGNDKYDR